MNVKEYFKNISNEVKLPFAHAFWDENIYGKKPDEFCVWRFAGETDVIISDDGAEKTARTFNISFFTKKDETADFQLEKIAQYFLLRGECASNQPFEDYEPDTGYFHYEISATITNNF